MLNTKLLFRNIIKIPIGFLLYFCIKKKINRGLTIFVYHEVTDFPSQFSTDYSLSVTLSTFEKQVSWIKKNFKIIHPLDLLSNNKLPESAAIISFDDGMKSSFENGLRILEEMNIPSIFFLNMGHILDQDPLESAFVSYLGRNSNEFKLFCEQRDINKPYHLTFKPDDKVMFLKIFKNIQKNKIEEYLGEFANLKLVQKWSDSKLVVYGNHLYKHWNSNALNEIEFLEQYNKNKKSIDKFYNFIDYFSFPNGQPESCFNSKHIELLRVNKVKKLFSSAGNINSNQNNYLLDRISLGPYDINEFAMWFKIGKNIFKKNKYKYNNLNILK